MVRVVKEVDEGGKRTGDSREEVRRRKGDREKRRKVLRRGMKRNKEKQCGEGSRRER